MVKFIETTPGNYDLYVNDKKIVDVQINQDINGKIKISHPSDKFKAILFAILIIPISMVCAYVEIKDISFIIHTAISLFR